MRIHRGRKLFSSQDLRDFTECKFAVNLDIRSLEEPIQRKDHSEWLQILFRKGNEFEEDYLAFLRDNSPRGTRVTDIPGDRSLEDRVRLTHEAMVAGVDLIYQAALHSGDWHGYADILRRIDGRSVYGDYSYEVIDIKSRLEPRPENILQISLYTFLLGAIQDSVPERMYIVTGDMEEHIYRYSDFSHYFLAVLRDFETYVDSVDPELDDVPLPCSFCKMCKWLDHCDSVWKAVDHVSTIGGVNRRQAAALSGRGVESVTQLAVLDDGFEVPGIGEETLSRIRTNAVLRLKKRETGEPQYRMKDIGDFRGFNRLPRPSSSDLFFDIESFPAFPGRRLEYLFGFHDMEEGRFVGFWAHSHEEEREAFQRSVDFMTGRLVSDPDCHVYHYGPYEETQLKRLSAQYATRESEVDEILRSSKLVDLLKVTRESILTSERTYSLKDMEGFFAPERSAEVRDAESSMVMYEMWRTTGDEKILEEIRRYNQEDCENTLGLRDWLVDIRPEKKNWFEDEPFDADSRTGASDDDLADLLRRLSESAPPGTEEMRQLSGQLTRFHRRASKPQWWDFFARADMTEEQLVRSTDCLGGLEVVEAIPPSDGRGNHRFWCTFPEQEHKFSVGADCNLAGVRTETIDPLDRCGRIEDIDYENRRVLLSRSRNLPELPERFSIVPGRPIPTHMLAASVSRYCESLMDGGDKSGALTDILSKNIPVVRGRVIGEPLLLPGNTLDDSVIATVGGLSDSYLAIQGPPGTGKTTLASKTIVELIRQGYRVGVSSNSHGAIHELLDGVERYASHVGFDFEGLKKASVGFPNSFFDGRFIDNVHSVTEIDLESSGLVAGTVFLFCNERLEDSLDFLFVDEAGQVSLGHLAAMGAAARNIVLIGDQMQLGQPVAGTHPGVSGNSTLEFLLDGQDTVPEHLGILLPVSYRLNPLICDFISEAVYDGRLRSAPENWQQNLDRPLDDRMGIPSEGIGFVEVDHEGRSQRSEEEAVIINRLFESALESRYTDTDGKQRHMTIGDIGVVTPYNAQVNYLKELLPNGARVGTIDMFQGQEVQVVLISMCTSGKDDLPRNMEFLFSRNRLNVAISRARCLAVIVASRRLLTVPCDSIDQMKLVNFLCWSRDYARERADVG